MFDTLTQDENTQLYMTIRRGFEACDKVLSGLMGLGEYDACSRFNAMNHDLVLLLKDLNTAAGL